MTYLVLGFLECRLNIVRRFPDPWDTLLVISESLLECASQTCQDSRVGRLLLELLP